MSRLTCIHTEPVFKRRDQPIPCARGYSLDLYCQYENPDHTFDGFPVTIYDRSETGANRQARKQGWVLYEDGRATCPRCARRLRSEGDHGKA